MSLHPFITAMLATLAGRPAISAGSPEDARALVAAGRPVLGEGPAMARTQDVAIPGRSGSIPARLYRPVETPRGVIVYLHGGGWVVGALDDYATYAKALAAATNCAVLLPDYRLAPEHQFPAGLEDTEDAIRWAARGETGLPANLPLVIAGDSAGANLATVAARRLRGEVKIRLQVLTYPVTACDFDNSSYTAHGAGLPLTRRDMEWFFEHYAQRQIWGEPDISPLAATDLAGMPETVLVTAQYDVLCDEGEAYADALRAAGVRVTQRRVDGVTHGFIRLHNLFDVARTELETVAADIVRAIETA